MQEDDKLPVDAGAPALVTTDNLSEVRAAEATPKPEANKDSAEPGSEPSKAGEDANDDDADAGEKAGSKRKSGAARAKETIQQLRERVADLESRASGASGAGDDKPPKLEDFSDFDAYENAKATYAVRQAIKAERLNAVETESKAAKTTLTEELIAAHIERANTARKVFDDFDKVIQSARQHEIRNDIADLVIDSDKSELLQYELARKPDLIRELNRMSPTAAARRIGQLEARLFYPKPKTDTNAPPPVGALSGGSSPAKSLADASYAEYRRLRMGSS